MRNDKWRENDQTNTGVLTRHTEPAITLCVTPRPARNVGSD
jgi:hypothetical protein